MKKYAIAGTGSRGTIMYAESLTRDFKDAAEICGIFDSNRKRCEVLNRRTGISAPIYEDFDELLREARPDVVIVATVDRFHHEYIIKALEAGCGVISEKPLTTDREKLAAILSAEKRTGGHVTVTFNMRFMPFAARIRELLNTGAIGEILSINLEWMLDTKHGGDYFRRWHREKINSGGLLVHKASHHFDLVNWFVGQQPLEVDAFGTLRYYGTTGKVAFADKDAAVGKSGQRCMTCLHQNNCGFYYDLTADADGREFYLDCEDMDGYHRDGCVFDEKIDIEDTVGAVVRYSGGAILTYSLTAHSPYEGYKLSLNGTNGRIEARDYHGTIGAFANEQIYKLRLYDREGRETDIPMQTYEGSHGGGDERLLNMLIRGGLPDPLGQTSNSRAGAMAVAVGIGANLSIKENRRVRIDEIVQF